MWAYVVEGSGEMVEQCTVNVIYMILCYMPAFTDLLSQHMDMVKCNQHGSVTQIQCCFINNRDQSSNCTSLY
jgi:hypothetical protein